MNDLSALLMALPIIGGFVMERAEGIGHWPAREVRRRPRLWVPVLILAGGRDRRARPDEARAIHDRVRSHARLSVFEGADHLKLLDDEPGRYRRELLGFVRSVASRVVAGRR